MSIASNDVMCWVKCPINRLVRTVVIDYAYGYELEPALEDFTHFFKSLASTAIQHLEVRLIDFDGDELVAKLVESGLLSNLRYLHLSICNITDQGAQLLMECPYTSRLNHLDLYDNHITSLGIQMLGTMGVVLYTDDSDI